MKPTITPAELTTFQTWTKAFQLWKGGLRSPNTRRVYGQAWDYFLAFVGKPPWRVMRSDIIRYKEYMRAKGLALRTMHGRISALSAFFLFTINDFTVPDSDGQEAPLCLYNPAGGKALRDKICPYDGKSVYLSADQVKQLLAVISRSTIQGLRDYALFLCYLLTGRRNSELRLLRWSDIEQRGEQRWYLWSGKGKSNQRNELPGAAWDAIRAYLEAAGRWGQMKAEDYIFTGLFCCDQSQAISMREVGRLLKGYCRRAGLDTTAIHVHSLRHTAAWLRLQAGDSILQICKLLGHNSISTTQIYLQALQGLGDESWSKVSEMIGI